MSSPTLSFGPDFEKLIARVLHHDPIALSQVAHTLRPDHFDVAACGWAYGAMRDHLLDYKGPLTAPILEERLRTAVGAGDIARADVPSFVRLLDEIEADVLPGERDYVLGKVSDFLVYQSLRTAMERSLDLMGKGDWEAIRGLMRKALDAGIEDAGTGLHYFRDAVARLMAAREEALTRVWPTGIPDLDAELHRGGLGAGELGLILAPTNRGKSIALLAFARRALVGGAKVVLYTLEMSADSVAGRADAAWTGLPMAELEERADEVALKIGRLHETFGDAFIIKQWAPHVATVEMIRAHVEQLRSTGFTPDMLVVDYGDLLKPQARYSERRHELAVLFEEIRGLAVEYDCPVWSASQANRSSLKKEVVGLEDLSESFDKAMIADVVIALCQTQEEEQMTPPRMRLFVAKNRSSRKGRIIEVETDFARMCFALPRR